MTGMQSGEFKFPSIASVVFGRGSVQRLPEKVEELGAKRVLVVTVQPVLTETDLVERVKNALGVFYVGAFDGVLQHVPRQCVIEGAEMAREVGADILISVGGSSAADAAKAINLVLTEGDGLHRFFDKFDSMGDVPASQYEKIKIPQISIPTTLSGGEFRPVAGITDTKRKIKESIFSASLAPKVVILDPDMTVFTPKELWAATGMKTLSDSFSKVCSMKPLPFSDALQLDAIRLINSYLMPSLAEPLDLEARSMLLHASWESAYGDSAAGMGLGIIAALRHQIGAGYNVPHGVASCIIFPYGLDFYRPVIDDSLVAIARALELPIKAPGETSDAVVHRVKELIGEIGLPTRLRDVGVPKEALEAIALASFHDSVARETLTKLDMRSLLDVLEEAW
jgi:alcohol dehydrogenase class IV